MIQNPVDLTDYQPEFLGRQPRPAVRAVKDGAMLAMFLPVVALAWLGSPLLALSERRERRRAAKDAPPKGRPTAQQLITGEGLDAWPEYRGR